MATSVVAYTEDHLVRDTRRRDTRPPKTGLDEAYLRNDVLEVRIKHLAALWERQHRRIVLVQHLSVQTSSTEQVALVSSIQKSVQRELFRPDGTAALLEAISCSHEDAVTELPRDYSCTDSLASVHLSQHCNVMPGGPLLDAKTPSSNDDIDWSDVSGVRSHANKKAKKAAAAAQKSKWGDDDGDEKAEGEGEGGEGGGDGGDAGAGGDGGADPPPPGGDGGGDDGDDFGFGGGKKKKDKKKKKDPWAEMEEEEQKKKDEEEAQKAADDAAAGGDPPADAGAGEDDWGGFSTGKKAKKGKKGKTFEPEPEPAAEPAMESVDLGASATLSAPADAEAGEDDWGGFTSGKKAKKGKKGKVCFSLFLIFDVFILWKSIWCDCERISSVFDRFDRSCTLRTWSSLDDPAPRLQELATMRDKAMHESHVIYHT